ncbi:MAG TPA: hypothetical protein VMX94_02985 [Armatimonadota bacterium]|nr:hypothetical protein [Armatimonadota bacterium]
MRFLPLTVLILMVTALPAFGASSYLGGLSGNILTPDGVVVPPGTWEASYHSLPDIFDNRDLTTVGVTYGLVGNLEVGVSFVSNHESDTALNAKYRLMPETPTRPAVLVGVFDIGSTVETLDKDDPGLFIVFSKSVTPAAENRQQPLKPLQLSVGFGTGVFDGVFAGLDWTVQPQMRVIAEYFGGKIGRNDNLFNAGIRYAPTGALRLDVAAIDFEDVAFGVNYRIAY